MITQSNSLVTTGLRPGWFHSVTARLLAGVLALSVLAPQAEAKRYGGGGGKSFSSGSRSSGSSGTKSGGYSSGRSSYSSGSSKPAGSAPAASSSRSGYDSSAARAKQQADSQNRYNGSKPPPIPAGGTSSSSTGTTGSYRGGSTPPPIPYNRGYSSSSGGYSGNSQPYRRGMSTGTKAALIGAAVLAPALMVYASRPAVHYQDSFGSPFWYWLLDQPQDVRANWLYHHQADVAPERRAELLKADPALQEKLDALAAQKVPVEPNYAPPGLTADDMFTDTQQVSESSSSSSSGSGSSALFWLILLGGSAAGAWLVFGKRWKPAMA